MNFLIYIGTNPQDETFNDLAIQRTQTSRNNSYIVLLSNV